MSKNKDQKHCGSETTVQRKCTQFSNYVRTQQSLPSPKKRPDNAGTKRNKNNPYIKGSQKKKNSPKYVGALKKSSWSVFCIHRGRLIKHGQKTSI